MYSLSIVIPHDNTRIPKLDKTESIVNIIQYIIETQQVEPSRFTADAKMMIQRLQENEIFFVPHANNIGISVSFDNIPTDTNLYRKCIDSIIQKKRSSKSAWLVI